MILGFDPGRDKCGIAVMQHTHGSVRKNHIAYAEVIAADEAIVTVLSLIQRYPISTIVMGDQTMAKTWKARIENKLTEQRGNGGSSSAHLLASKGEIPLVMVDERYSSLEARQRYWALHPPQGLTQLIPKVFRTIPRPIDDVVAIILIERYWQMVETLADELPVSPSS